MSKDECIESDFFHHLRDPIILLGGET
jgi:hypothetical protein